MCIYFLFDIDEKKILLAMCIYHSESEDDLTAMDLPVVDGSKPETFRNFCLTDTNAVVACSSEG